ncbi:hypothetical protein MKW92_007921 [Papaver armeniacum]|nr:hypothetical protein MKW92_007921 [Papaver armeniacum]
MRQLKRLQLTGELPDDFANFPFLRELDLNLNYLSGSIPKAWKVLPLVNLLLLANNINGLIPKEIADIVTLEYLVLTDNQLEGPLPPELGKLTKLTSLAISGNNFTGALPATFANLKNMVDFRIAGTSISGNIPDFFGNWTQLNELDIRGTSMEGPIPSTIFHLKNLTKLRVSDLKGPNMPFPNFQDMNRMSQLELRNCLIKGSIPSNIGEMMPLLVRLDLSFNRLTGDIHNLQEIPNLKYMYLTNNQLTGQIPIWITNAKQNFDLSYNNFIGPSQSGCQDSNLNKISSYPSDEDRSIAWCLKKDLPCSTTSKYSSFFINCGGSEMAIGDENYDADVSPMGPSSFYSYNDKWACSTTGDFIVPLLKGKPNYLAQASPNITVTDLYMTARISPLSLKYYGICLRPGNYKVKLHFAEIMFPIDKIASGIGTRIFDVSIQGKIYLKDFNIEEEAKGVGKSIIKEYNVDVTSSTLEIHLYWAGKGTSFIPSDFAYGPLISAIAVTPNFGPDTGHISVGVIAGILAASFVLIILILSILWKKGYLGKEDLEDKELRELLQTSYFTLREVKAATKNFDRANKIGEGGFGPVYKGLRPDGSLIAVKQLSAMSKQGNREFVNEIGIISALQHPNLVKLFGCCVEGNQLLVIYEYMENNSLARALYVIRNVTVLGRADQRLNLDWPTRGYMAPEYASSGRLTYKADVYSFGIVALEIVSGKSNTTYMTDDEYFCLLDWANVLKEQGNLLDLVDPILKSNYSKKEVLRMLNIALLCTNRSPALRPMMSTVVGMLKGRLPVQESYVVSSARTDDTMSSASASASEGISYDTQIHTTSSQGSTLLEMTNSTVEDPRQADSTFSTYYSTKQEDETRGH